jgi:hypothetical protein
MELRLRNMLAQPKSTITIRRLMDEGAIVICNLAKGRLGESITAHLLGALITDASEFEAGACWACCAVRAGPPSPLIRSYTGGYCWAELVDRRLDVFDGDSNCWLSTRCHRTRIRR